MPKTNRGLTSILCFFIASIILILGCQKEFTSDIPGGIPPITNSTSVEGRITDEGGMPVSDATVKAGLNTTKTDKNGMFKFADATFTTEENFVTVSKSGYFQGSRTFFARQNSNNYVRIELMRKAITARFSASSGGDVSTRSGESNIHFESNSFVTISGAPYNGTVLVATQYLDPTKANISEQMPGDLRGVNLSGSTVGLNSYGMLAVELLDEGGQKLQLKAGTKATLTVGIPSSKAASAPSSIPLWYFNDSTGLWKQEGNAVKSGDTYIGDVSHFTFWNCDDPFAFVKITAHVVTNTGIAIAGAKVKISSASGASAWDYTDNNGYVDGFVPKNETLTLEVINTCGQSAYTATVGPYSSETNIGNIAITQNTTTIYGTAVSCANTPVTDGYVQINLNGATEFAGITNGSFSSTFLSCAAGGTAQLIAVDNGTTQQGSATSLVITGNNINAGALTACGVSAATFFNLTVNGVLISGNSGEFYRNGWKDLYDTAGNMADYNYATYDSTLSKYIYASLTLPANQVFSVPSSFNNQLTLGYANINTAPNIRDVELSPLNGTDVLNFTEYGTLGQFIAGNFTGMVVRTQYDSSQSIRDTVNAILTFRVRHTTNPF